MVPVLQTFYTCNLRLKQMEQHVLDTNAGKQLS